jgi:erythromycin esterase
VRGWNLAHPRDPVRIVGVDPQDNEADRDVLARFLADAYGPETAARWAPAAAELAAADRQTPVFGDSGIADATRQLALEALARLETDAPLLRTRLGAARLEGALTAARGLGQFADFNQSGGLAAHSRDWYMAVNLLDAVERLPAGKKAVYWAHNAHVSAAKTGWGPTGALLREALGCDYRAVAFTFGEGSFIAQVPNDPADRLASNEVAAPAEDSVETVLGGAGQSTFFASWGCPTGGAPTPAWLREPRPMRWIGGLYAPGSEAEAGYRPYRLTEAFDGIVYLPRVTAESPPADRPPVARRER